MSEDRRAPKRRIARAIVTCLGTIALGCASDVGAACPTDEVECDGRCVVLAYEAAHCGACGVACGCDEICVDGSCAPAAGGTATVEIGTPCDPGAAPGTMDNPCPDGQTPSTEGVLACDPIEEACGVPCANDADCRAAGLGYVCDLRTLEDVDPAFAGDTRPRQFCTNAACF